MLKVQEYLKNNPIENLEKDFGIVVRKYDDRIVLNYSQIDSKKFVPESDECRGLILSYPDLNILCRSFDRFYNHWEGNYGKDFVIKDSIIFDKIDGSLINFYHDGENWQCATRGTAFAEGPTNLGGEFRKGVERALGFKIERLEKIFYDWLKDYTVITEFVSPESRVVVRYPQYKLYVLAVRNKHTGDYLPVYYNDQVADLLINRGSNVTVPKKYRFNNFEDLTKIVEELDPFAEEGEGYVCYNPNDQRRMKVKNPKHTAIAHMRENGIVSNKRIAVLVFKQDYEEYLHYFPEDREFFDPYIKAYDRMINHINEVWENTKNIEEQKEFALQVKDLPIGFALFRLRKGGRLEDTLNNINDKKKQELLEKYMEEQNE